MSEHKVLLVFAASQFTFNVFSRMQERLAQRDWSLAIVTPLPSVTARARARNIRVALLRIASVEADIPLYPERCTEVRQARISRVAAAAYQDSVWEAIHRLRAECDVSAVAVWNGLQLGESTLIAVARSMAIPTVFLELGNIEPKLFMDPEGVGPDSKVARLPQILDSHSVEDQEIEAWKNAYILRRTTAPAQLPQVHHFRSLNPLVFGRPWYLFDRLAIPLTRAPQPAADPLIDRLRLVWSLLRRSPLPDVLPPKPYVFLPLQVSTDSNLLVFSKFGNMTAIEQAVERARARGARLVVKPHPAERNDAELSRIADVCREHGYLITSHNTTALVQGAEEVVTINSTVGLEAMIFGIPVTILGKSIYAGFSQRQAAIYAMRYLAPFEPHGKAKASEAVVAQLLSIIGEQAQRPSSTGLG